MGAPLTDKAILVIHLAQSFCEIANELLVAFGARVRAGLGLASSAFGAKEPILGRHHFATQQRGAVAALEALFVEMYAGRSALLEGSFDADSLTNLFYRKEHDSVREEPCKSSHGYRNVLSALLALMLRSDQVPGAAVVLVGSTRIGSSHTANG